MHQGICYSNKGSLYLIGKDYESAVESIEHAIDIQKDLLEK